MNYCCDRDLASVLYDDIYYGDSDGDDDGRIFGGTAPRRVLCGVRGMGAARRHVRARSYQVV